MLDLLSKAFSGANLGNTLKGVGALATAYGAYQNAKLQENMFDLQKAQLDEEKKRRDKSQSNWDSAFANVWGDTSTQPSLPTVA
jgi:hypothetical protein